MFSETIAENGMRGEKSLETEAKESFCPGHPRASAIKADQGLHVAKLACQCQ